MSVRLAAGWALSRFQGVSVVPMIQCRPHGITNSTDVSVRMMNPASERIRSRGTTRWIPFDACTCSAPRPPTSSWISSVQTPAALTTTRARTSSSWPASRSTRADADHALALAQEAGHLHPGGDLGAVARGGARDREHQPGVVDLAVVVADRAGDRLGREVRGDPGDTLAGTGAGAAAAHVGLAEPRHRVVERAARRRRRVAPSRGGSAGRGTAPAGPGAAPAG